MDQGPNQPPQQGSPAGGRRRRRRRGGKTKGAQPPVAQGQGQSQGPPKQYRQQRGGGASSGPSGGYSSGHQQNGGGQRRGRTNRRRGATPFVGPMDHSYRNGNAVDGNRQPPNLVPPRFSEMEVDPVVHIREDAPARIFCFIDDLFFVAKINETARKLNVKVQFLREPDEVIERYNSEEVPADEKPTLVVVDLNNFNIKPLPIISKLRTKLKKDVSVVGFLSHLQGELKLKAQEAGCDTVMPRSAFSQNLPQLLRRHAAPEELEHAVE